MVFEPRDCDRNWHREPQSPASHLQTVVDMTKPRNPLDPSAAEIARAKDALLKKERADAAAQATTDYKAAQEAQRAKTERLRALRLAKEKAGRAKKKG